MDEQQNAQGVSRLEKARPYMKSLHSYGTGTRYLQFKCLERFTDDEFRKLLVRESSANKNCHDTKCVTDVTEVLWEPVEVYGYNGIMYRPERRNSSSIVVSPGNTNAFEHARNNWGTKWWDLATESSVTWIEKGSENKASFMWFGWFVFLKEQQQCRKTALVACSV